jgi:hypothetical protein
MHVGFVPLMELYGIYKALGQTFFDRNIRAALKPDNAPNKKLREALDKIVLKSSEEPSVFVFRHNGVTTGPRQPSLPRCWTLVLLACALRLNPSGDTPDTPTI